MARRTPPLRALVLGALLAFGPAAAFGQAGSPAATAPPAAPAAATVADLAWIAGSWHGEIEGAIVEEVWTAPAAGAMLGMFRWVQGEKVIVYELLALEPTAEGPVLRLLHFGPGLAGWEEKGAPVTFHLVSYRPGEAAFDNRDPARPTKLVYRKAGDGALTVVLERVRDGKASSQDFNYKRW